MLKRAWRNRFKARDLKRESKAIRIGEIMRDMQVFGKRTNRNKEGRG